MAKSKHSLLLEKSIQAVLSAIELYNKPIFSYREESFSILMVNAWELLLKAKKLKDNNSKLTCLYIPVSKKTKTEKPRQRFKYKTTKSGNYLTLGISELIEQEIKDNNLKIQLETLVEIRDNAIHFYNASKYFEKQLLEVAIATLKSYKVIVEEWFSESLDKFDLFLIPIAFNIPQTFSVESLSQESETHKKLLGFISKQRQKEDNLSEHDIALVIDVKLNRADKGMQVRFDKDGIPVHQDSEEIFKKKYPLDYKSLILKLKNRYTDFKQDQIFNKLKKELCKRSEFSGERFLDYEKMSGTKKTYYSSNIIREFDKHYTIKKS
ncbi:MAG TPA: DUF3644 domain-containing protein [Burkholderiales bacterium]|nr:DUF3644 domain-containing protein [Burkholderiales bacterium]